MRTAASITWTLAIAAIMASGGCSGKNQTGFDPTACVGTWLEVTNPSDPGFPGRVAPPEKPAETIRMLTINPDRTFELQMCKPGGTPIEGKVARGSWKVEGRRLVFEVNENNLDEADRERVPSFTREPRKIETPTGQVLRLRLVDQSGLLVVMKPQG